LSVLPICLGSIELSSQLNTLTFTQPDSDVDLTVNIVTVNSIAAPNVRAQVNGKNDDSVLIVSKHGSEVSATISLDRSAIGGRSTTSSSTSGTTSRTTSGTSSTTSGGSTSGTTKSHSNSDSGSDSAASSFSLSYFCVLLSVVGLFSTSRKGAALICVIAFIAMLSMPSHADSLASKKVKITLNIPKGWSINGIPSLPSEITIILETILVFSHPGLSPSPSQSCIPNDPPIDTCEHSLCLAPRLPLVANCSSCASLVCAADSFCCDASVGMWDIECISFVNTLCTADLARCCA